MDGTSAAAPMVAGVVALMLEANPNLTWRDARYILATTARKNDPSDYSGWTTNGAGWHINHNYGFGAVDALAAVQKARDFVSLGELKTYEQNETINASVNFASSYNIPKINISGSDINKIEHVDVWVDIDDHLSPRKLNITLTAPSNTKSELARNDFADTYKSKWKAGIYNGGYRFGSTRHLDESANGDWKLTISDSNTTLTTFRRWGLTIYGRSH
jgi:kexin